MKSTFSTFLFAAFLLFAGILTTSSGCKTTPVTVEEETITNQYARLPLDIDTETQKEANRFSWAHHVSGVAGGATKSSSLER